MAPPTSTHQFMLGDLQFKYRTAGVRKYWVIDKPLQKVTVFDFENDKFRNYDVENESVVNPHSRCIINRKS